MGRGYAGVLENCTQQNVSFKFFSPHNVVVLFSTSDVDFVILFLKKWYFFRKKNQAIMNVFFSVAGEIKNLLHTLVSHLNYTLPIKYSILGLLMFFCFTKLKTCNWTFSLIRKLQHFLDMNWLHPAVIFEVCCKAFQLRSVMEYSLSWVLTKLSTDQKRLWLHARVLFLLI